ncbi:hypothetical protein HY571_01025 [Candidatus Micrarchaeota archaeon]|nr:hypothetical protein [Candidatus Micrarchaeota archaeon]
MKIKVDKKTDNFFNVEVGNSATTHHGVILDNETFKKLGRGKTREEFVKKCFEFLLARESNKSILRNFNVKVISGYFPEFEEEIAK